MLWIPRYNFSHETPAIFTCNLSLLFNSVLLATIKFDSWFAIIFWLFSGLILVLQSLVKCDVFCCFCLEYPVNSSQSTLLLQEEGSSSQAAKHTTIRLKAPPMASSVVNHVQSRR